MREKVGLACLGAGLGLAGPALCVPLLGLESGAAPAAAAWAAGLMLAWSAAPGLASAPAALCLAASSALCAPVLLPLIGVRLTLLAAALLAASALKLGARTAPGPGRRTAPWAAALGAGAAVIWVRLLVMLGGDALWSLTVVTSAAAAGTAAAAVWTERARDGSDGGPELWGLASGLGGLLGLSLLRFVGFNEGSAELLQRPAAPSFLLQLGSHAWLAVFAWCAAAAAASRPGPGRASGLAAAFGALAAAGIAARFGAAPTATLLHGLMVLAGLLAVGPRNLSPTTMLGQGAAAALLAAAWLGAAGPGLAGDVWLNRLNAAFPGGRYLAAWDDSRETLAYYRFSSGATVLLRDGAAWSNPDAAARRQVHLAVLAHPKPASLLLATLSPFSVTSALGHGLAVRLAAGRAGQSLIRAGWTAAWPPPGLTLESRGLRRALARPQTYDIILLELPIRSGRPASLDRELFAAARARLNAGGLLALRVPAPRAEWDLPPVLAAAAASFPEVGAFDLPGGPLLLFSLEPLDASAATLGSRLTSIVGLDDPQLAADLGGIPWLTRKDLPAAAARVPTGDKP